MSIMTASEDSAARSGGTVCRRLPLNIPLRAVAFVWTNFGAVIRIGLIPLIVLVAAQIGFTIYFQPATVLAGAQRVVEPNWEVTIIWSLIGTVLGAIFAVGIHRFAIMGESRSGFFYFRLQREELIYILAGLIILFSNLFVFWAIASFVYFGFQHAIYGIQNNANAVLETALPTAIILTIILLSWPVIRLALIFPHAAIAGELNFSLSWHAMKGHFWRFIANILILILLILLIYAGIVLVAGLLAAALAIIIQLTGIEIQREPSPIFLILSIPITALFIAVIGLFQALGVVFLSFCYKALVLGTYEVGL